MRLIVTLLCALCLIPSVVLGKSLYVSGYREIMLRTGPSLQHKILAILKTGQEVSLTSEEGDYYIVALPNGTKGYVLKTYLTDQVPAETRLQELEPQTQQRIKELEAKTQEQEKELAALREERTQLLESAKQQAEVTTSLQPEHALPLQTPQGTTEHDGELQWFITGAGVLFAGWLLGRMTGGRRNRHNGLSLGRL